MNLLDTLSTSAWGYPIVEIFHLVGVSALLGNLLLFELRVLGLGTELEIRPLARFALPLVIGGFVLAALSGLLMFATQPWDLLPNPAFRLKMLLLLVAGSNAAWFHYRGSLGLHDTIARAQAVASLLVWVSVLACGRAIAYV